MRHAVVITSSAADVIAAAPTSRRLSVTPYFVIPAKAGIQTRYPCDRVATLAVMDSRLRGNDAEGSRATLPSVITANAGSRPYSAGWSPWPSRPGTGPSVGVSGPAMPTTVLPSSPGR